MSLVYRRSSKKHMLTEKQKGPRIKFQIMLIFKELTEKVFTDDAEEK